MTACPFSTEKEGWFIQYDKEAEHCFSETDGSPDSKMKILVIVVLFCPYVVLCVAVGKRMRMALGVVALSALWLIAAAGFEPLLP